MIFTSSTKATYWNAGWRKTRNSDANLLALAESNRIAVVIMSIHVAVTGAGKQFKNAASPLPGNQHGQAKVER